MGRELRKGPRQAFGGFRNLVGGFCILFSTWANHPHRGLYTADLLEKKMTGLQKVYSKSS
jgi:hypothetical protein